MGEQRGFVGVRRTGRCQLPLAPTTDPLAHGEVHVTLALSLRRDDDKCSVSRENGEKVSS